MATFGERLKQLRTEKNITLEKMADLFETTKATLSRYENSIREPKMDFIQKCAIFFDCSTDYLTGTSDVRNTPKKEWQPELTQKDEKDIEKTLNKTLEMLEKQEGLMLSGELIDEDDFELIKAAIQNGLEYAKKVNKKKYTPKKFRK